jgi:hypothetical protein
MKRCIRDSIQELSAHPRISKELLFMESDKGDKGFELVKKGKSIVGIKFLFRWIQLGSVEELNQHDAMKTIKELEFKRVNHDTLLTDAELEALSIAYHYIGRPDRAQKIEEILSRQQFSADTAGSQAEDDIQSFMDKMDTFLEINNNPDYR